MTEATAFTAPPDLLKRFVAAPLATSLATPTAIYQLRTNCAQLCNWLAGTVEAPSKHWNCTILCDPDYPIDSGDDLTLASEGHLLQLRPGCLISVDHVRHCIIAFLSDLLPDQAAAVAFMQELICLSQTVAHGNHADETELS